MSIKCLAHCSKYMKVLAIFIINHKEGNNFSEMSNLMNAFKPVVFFFFHMDKGTRQSDSCLNVRNGMG